ncbi:MAG: DUF4364 family protein [Eubacteriales bacterium]|nr:DUF4364 family protein [Eubacteriales bacterium]
MPDQLNMQANQVKLILLALVKSQPGLSPGQIQALAQETLFFDYFTVAEAWASLLDQKLISVAEPKYNKQRDLKGQTLLASYLTEAGQLVYEQLHKQLSPALLEQIRNLGQVAQNQAELKSYFEDQGDGSYLLHCEAWDRQSKILDLQLQLSSPDRARAFSEAWPDRASQIYTFILTELNRQE